MPADVTPALGLPLLHAAQAQKEITHNEALAVLDIVAAGVVEGGPIDTPPVDAVPGCAWIVGEVPIGAWSGQADALALMTEGGWRFVVPPTGFTARNPDGLPVRRTPTGWSVGEIHAASVVVDGDVVLSGRQPAIPDPVGGGVIDSEARAALDSILAAMRSHGLIG